jgi:hypothetical protein
LGCEYFRLIWDLGSVLAKRTERMMRPTDFQKIGATMCLVLLGLNAEAQRKPNVPANSASHVPAEMTGGRLKPSETKPGDGVALRLKDDLKANGEIVLKKGTPIAGVVRNVKHVETKGQAQSMMQIEWFAPPLQGKTARHLSILLQSVTQTDSVTGKSQSEEVGQYGFSGADALRNETAVRNQVRNAALLNMPYVMPVDTKTASSLESNFGPSLSQLFKVGRSEWTTGGSKQSVELFSHLSNDTMITSSTDFEISRGAQMQLLVGVSKQ